MIEGRPLGEQPTPQRNHRPPSLQVTFEPHINLSEFPQDIEWDNNINILGLEKTYLYICIYIYTYKSYISINEDIFVIVFKKLYIFYFKLENLGF